MRRIFLFLLSLSVAIVANAQLQRGLKGDFNTDNFPKVSFVWNTPSPEVLDKSQFVLTEDGKNVDFEVSALSADEKGMSCDKSILFLWEDMASHSGQYGFTKQLLNDFFGGTSFGSGDKLSVAVFNRKKDGRDILQTITDGFETDPSSVADAVNSYGPSKERYGTYPLQSDLYLAISSGIELLKKEPSNRLGVIVVITAGLNVKAPGASTEMATVRQTAIDAGIPIYVVKYPAFGDAPEVNTLAESTYGQHVSTKDAGQAENYLNDFYQNFERRGYGNDYQITFTSTAKKDGKLHNIGLKVDKVDQNIPAFTSPDMTFGEWISENLILFIVLVVVAIALIVLAVWLIRNSIKKRNRRIADSEAALQSEIQRSNQAMNELQQRHEMEKQQREAEAALKAKTENEARLADLMHTKNMYPRLQCQVGGMSFAYTMDKPHLTLGRDKNNDVVLVAGTVSGFHAEINFDGTAFQIVNKSQTYSQGIIVNGQFYQQYTLKNGDMIGLGEALVSFYL